MRPRIDILTVLALAAAAAAPARAQDANEADAPRVYVPYKDVAGLLAPGVADLLAQVSGALQQALDELGGPVSLEGHPHTH